MSSATHCSTRECYEHLRRGRWRAGMPNRNPYPSDVSDEEGAFVASYRALIRQETPQGVHDLMREIIFNAPRWIVRTRTSVPWQYMPTDVPPREAVYQQTRRGPSAGVFEAMVRTSEGLAVSG
jgi:hypothetical protein